MIKIYAFLVKLEQLSDEEFHAHWRDPHGTLTKRIPQFKRYEQNHGIGPVPSLPGLNKTQYLGIPAVWVDTAEDLGAAQSHPDYVPLDADGDLLYDKSQIDWLLAHEQVILPQNRLPGDACARAMLFLKARSQRIENENCVTAIAALRAHLPQLIGASFSLPLHEFGPSPYDAVMELDFANQSKLLSSWSETWDTLKPQLDFADLEASKGFRAQAERLI